MREWIAFPVITAHLPLPYFRLWCSETLGNGQTHPPFLLSHCWPPSFHKFLNHPKVSQFQFQMWSLCPPFTCLQAAAFPCLQTPLTKGQSCSSLSWMAISLSRNLLLLSYSVSISCSCPNYQFHILKLQQKNEPHTSENLKLLGNNHLAAVHCKKLLHSILLH